ncbi:MAG: uracil-DNA glycosylase family protein [Methylotenera sp.]
MAEYIESLLKEVHACKRCESSLPFSPNPILQLHPKAKILIAGQAPGRKAHLANKPFADASGDHLRSWLKLAVDDFYDVKKVAILPMGFCYPGTGKSGDLAPRPECAEQWRERLIGVLPNIALTIVIGQYAYQYYYPDTRDTLTDAVKSWSLKWPNQIVLPHPSPRNNSWLKRNGWFVEEVLPNLQERIQGLLNSS